MNAWLLAVREQPRSGGDWDDLILPGAAVWTGRADVYLRVRRVTRRTPEERDVDSERTLKVLRGDPPIDWRPGLELDVQRLDGTVFTVTTAVAIDDVQAPDPVFAEVDTITLTLQAPTEAA
jgi:hypothetical protein